MKLEKLLQENKSAIVDRWLDLILETYPADTRRFLKRQKDPFANPVGTTISKEIDALYMAFLQGIDSERISPILDRIIRIRAIQEFTPSQAVAFVFLLKNAVRENLGTEIRDNRLSEALLVMESRVDEMALLAFDVFMKCREKIFEIRANEAKNQVSRLLQRAGIVSEIPRKEPVSEEGNMP